MAKHGRASAVHRCARGVHRRASRVSPACRTRIRCRPVVHPSCAVDHTRDPGLHRDVRTCSRVMSRRAGGEFLFGTPRLLEVAFDSEKSGCTSVLFLFREGSRGRIRSRFAGLRRPGRVSIAPVAPPEGLLRPGRPRERRIRVPVGGRDRRRGVFSSRGRAANPPELGPGAAGPRRPPPRAVSSGPRGGHSGVGDRLSGGLVPLGGRGRHPHGHSPPHGGHGGRGDRVTGGWSPPDSARGGLPLLPRRPHGGCSSCRGPWGDVYEHGGPPGGAGRRGSRAQRGGSHTHRVSLGVERSVGTPSAARIGLAQDPETLLSAFWGALGGLYGVPGGPGGQDDPHRAPGDAPPPPSRSPELCFLRLGGPCMPCRGGIGPCGSALGGDSPLRGPSRGGIHPSGDPRGGHRRQPGPSRGGVDPSRGPLGGCVTPPGTLSGGIHPSGDALGG